MGGGDGSIGEAMEKVIQLSESIANLSALATASNSVAATLRSQLDSKMNEGGMILADCAEIVFPEDFDDFATLKLIRELGFEGNFFSHKRSCSWFCFGFLVIYSFWTYLCFSFFFLKLY